MMGTSRLADSSTGLPRGGAALHLFSSCFGRIAGKLVGAQDDR